MNELLNVTKEVCQASYDWHFIKEINVTTKTDSMIVSCARVNFGGGGGGPLHRTDARSLLVHNATGDNEADVQVKYSAEL